MPFFDKLFTNKQSEKPSNLEKIEKVLNCQFPRRFHELIRGNMREEIILELPDEKYRILSSITTNGLIDDEYEKVDFLSKDMKNHRALNSEKVKLPFARNLSGDQFKYLFFEGEEGSEFKEQIFLADIDSHVGQIEISKSVNLFNTNSKRANNSQIVIDCKPQSIEEVFKKFELPKPINYWQKSFGISSRENTENYPDNFSIQQHAVNYHFDNPTENIAKFEMQFVFAKGKKLFFTSSAYEVDHPNLEGSINYNVEYRTFYFKLFSILDGLIKSKQIAIEQGFITEEEFHKLIDIKQLFQITKQQFKSIDTKEV